MYSPVTIKSWNAARGWDFWQLETCNPRGGFAGAAYAAPASNIPLPGASGAAPNFQAFNKEISSSTQNQRGANRVAGVKVPEVSLGTQLAPGDEFVTGSDVVEGQSPTSSSSNGNRGSDRVRGSSRFN